MNEWIEVFQWLRGLGSSGADILGFLVFAGGMLANPHDIIGTAEAKARLTAEQIARVADRAARGFNAAFAPRFAAVLLVIAIEIGLVFLAVRGIASYLVDDETRTAYANSWSWFETFAKYGCMLVFATGLATFLIRAVRFYLFGAIVTVIAHLTMGVTLFFYAQLTESRELTVAATIVLAIGLGLTLVLAKLLRAVVMLLKTIASKTWPLVQVAATVLPGITDQNVHDKVPEPDGTWLTDLLDSVPRAVEFLMFFLISYMTTLPVVYPALWLASIWFVTVFIGGAVGPVLCAKAGLEDEVAEKAKTFYRWFYLTWGPTLIVVLGLHMWYLKSAMPSAIAMRSSIAMWKVNSSAVWAGISPVFQVEHWGACLAAACLVGGLVFAIDKPEKDKPSKTLTRVALALKSIALIAFLGFVVGVTAGEKGIHLSRDAETYDVKSGDIAVASTGKGEVTATWRTDEPAICGVVVREIVLPMKTKKYFDVFWEHQVPNEKAQPDFLPLERLLLSKNNYKELAERTNHSYRFNGLESGLTVKFQTVCAKARGEHAYEWAPSSDIKILVVDAHGPSINENAPPPPPSSPPAPVKAQPRSPTPPPVRVVKLDNAPEKIYRLNPSPDPDCDE